jgi:hypothetical protein
MKKTIALMLVAFATSIAADEVASFKGKLCFVAAKQTPACTDVGAATEKTAASDAERLFVWSSADGKRLAFGIVPPKSEAIDLSDKAQRMVPLTVRGDQRHGWPEELKIRVTDATKREWSWSVPAKTVSSLAQLGLLPGKYTVVFSADHHLTEWRRIDLVKDLSLREIKLRPMPVLVGRVMTMNDEPVANGRIVRIDRRLIATTDEQGRFSGEALEPLPDSVLVEKKALGSRVVTVQLATGDADLGVVRLGPAVKLALHIVRPDGNHDPLHVTLKRRPEAKYEYIPIASSQLKAKDDSLVFDDLSKGEYAVIIEGKGSLEKLVTDVGLGESDVDKEIRIEPYHLDGTARFGDDPMTGTLSVSMGHIQLDWSLPIEDGRFSATLWQHGKLDGWVGTKELGSPEPASSQELGADPSTWNIQFPKRFISGRIFDSESHEVISGAGLYLMRFDGLHSSIHLTEGGTFSIMATKTGTYELKASAPDHVGMKQTVEIHEDDGSMQRDFALTHGIPLTLEVTWPSGAPVTNATVMEGVASDGYNAERLYSLDASGRLTLRLQQGESRTLFIIPREGSFGIAHVAAQGTDSKTLRVVLPEPAGSLHIQISTADGKPAQAGVAMRFNGETIPTPVLYQIGFRGTPDALNNRSLLQLPAGAYDLWPISIRSYAPIGSVKSVSILAGAANVDLVANGPE